MSILSRLCRYVGTYGYTSSTGAADAGLLKSHPAVGAATGPRRRRRYARICVEEMEPRVMLTTLTNTSPLATSYLFFGADKKNFTVTIAGDMTVELFGSDGANLTDLIPGVPPPGKAPPVGVDIFSMYITSSNINSSIAINGTDIYTGGAGSLYTLVKAPGFPIGARRCGPGADWGIR